MQNLFAQVIEQMINSSPFSKEELSERTSIDLSDFDEWIKGDDIPPSNKLAEIVILLQQFSTSEFKPRPKIKKALEDFYLVADLKIDKVLPKHLADKLKGYATIGEYWSSVYLQNLYFDLFRVPSEIKRETIFFFSGICRVLHSLTGTDNQKNYLSASEIGFLKDKIENMTEADIREMLLKNLPK